MTRPFFDWLKIAVKRYWDWKNDHGWIGYPGGPEPDEGNPQASHSDDEER